MRLQALLFDADGVMQRASWSDPQSALAAILGRPRAELEQLTRELLDAERPSLGGAGHFVEDIRGVLLRWQLEARLDAVLAIWTTLEVDPAMVGAVRSLRARGLACCLATNQNPHRAAYMSTELGYAQLFDRELYSCHLGAAKPDPEYFRAACRVLSLAPSEILFVDDSACNVEAARSVGLHAALFTAERKTSARALRAILEPFGLAI